MAKNICIKKYVLGVIFTFLFLSFLDALAFRMTAQSDIRVPRGFVIEPIVQNLSAPAMVAFDDIGRMLIAESGSEPKITRIERDGSRTILADREDFGDELPVTAVNFYRGKIYAVHAGTISVIENGEFTPIITGLPGQGDHQANQIIFRGDTMYIAVGTVTNSAVVGPDNAAFGWLKNSKLRQLHDVPCETILLHSLAFESENALARNPERVRTSAYAPYGIAYPEKTEIEGDVKCNGAILKADLDGENLEVYAWGLRNSYGLEIGPDGAIYATMHGFDARGSRQIENAPDCFYRIEEGAWYGWPDFTCDSAITDSLFKPEDKPQPEFLLADHPTSAPPKPIAKFDAHSAANGFAFAPSRNWGSTTDAYVALAQSAEIAKVDVRTGRVSSFIKGGLERPSDVTFGPGNAMYIADSGAGADNSGVIWRVRPASGATGIPAGISLIYAAIGTIFLGLALLVTAYGGKSAGHNIFEGVWKGIGAGIIMAVFAVLVGALIFKLPWHAPPRVFATMAMGETAIANILEFDLLSVLAGLFVLGVLAAILGAIFSKLVRTADSGRVILAGVLFGLTGWAVLQYFVLPSLFPLVVEKGFTPFWFAATFGIFGLVLGILFSKPQYKLKHF